MQPLEVKTLELDSGEVPFESWLDSLGDVRLQAAVAARLARVRAGNLGDHKPLGETLFELRIAKGPGLRVYFGRSERTVVVLVGGGDKSTQRRDIQRARMLWRQFCDATQRLQSGPADEAQ